MKSNMIWANLAVENLERTTEFYTKLGFQANGIPNDQLTSFTIGENQFIINFFQKAVLQANMNIEIANARAAAEVLFTISAANETEVDQWAEKVLNAGGSLLSQPGSFGDGYYGFLFADPDGHRFNIFFM